MAFTTQVFYFFFVLATSFTPSSALDHHHRKCLETLEPNNNIVHITNSLPKDNSNPTTMNIHCSSKHSDFGEYTLETGKVYRWTVEDKALHYCGALWGTFIASWHAFQPKRDFGHPSVYWLVKENGFFLSWDNSSWVKKSVWETE